MIYYMQYIIYIQICEMPTSETAQSELVIHFVLAHFTDLVSCLSRFIYEFFLFS